MTFSRTSNIGRMADNSITNALVSVFSQIDEIKKTPNMKNHVDAVLKPSGKDDGDRN